MNENVVSLDLIRNDLTISKNFKRKTPSRDTDLLGTCPIFGLEMDRRCNAQRNSEADQLGCAVIHGDAQQETWPIFSKSSIVA